MQILLKHDFMRFQLKSLEKLFTWYLWQWAVIPIKYIFVILVAREPF